MSELTLNAEARTVLGKKVAQLRRNGQIPGVVYGPVVPETVAVSVNRREFDRFYKAHGHTTLFTLTWAGGSQPVFIREVQEDPVRREPLHIDFFAPNMRQVLRTMVQVVFHGPADPAEGVLTEVRTEVEVEALPTDVPQQLDVDITGLNEVGDALHVSDITAPQGVTILTSEDEVLAHVTAARVVEEPVAAEEEEAVAEEGEVEATAETEAATEGGEETESE